jgi:hypothetical protein
VDINITGITENIGTRDTIEIITAIVVIKNMIPIENIVTIKNNIEITEVIVTLIINNVVIYILVEKGVVA